MSNEQLLKFSEELKNAREKSNLTLQMLNQKTRIDIKFLQAIEEANFQVIDDVYIRAFIKGFAKNVGLDEDATLEKYSLAKQGKYSDESNVEKEEHSETTEEEKKILFTSEYVKPPVSENKSESKIDKRLLIIGLVLIVVAVIVYFIFFTNSSNTIIKENIIEQTSTKTEDPEAQRFEIVEEDEPVDEIIQTSDSLLLQVEAIERTWVRAIVDDNERLEFTLNSGDTKLISAASKYKLLIGNAGGIRMSLNGKDLGLRGNLGDIKNIEVDSSGIKYLRINSENSNESN
jgi:cytoskeleton protein RodZ